MLLFFVDGDNPENTKIQQCLSVFWPAYAFSSALHQINVASIFLDTLRTVVYAEKGSLFSKVGSLFPSDVLMFWKLTKFLRSGECSNFDSVLHLSYRCSTSSTQISEQGFYFFDFFSFVL
jgi:hypothetical protein